MTTRLVWLGGDPEGLRILSRSFRGSAARLSSINDALRDVCAASEWDSDAGRAFALAAEQPQWVMACLVTRYAGAAQALATLAGALEEAQGEVSAAMSSHSEGWRRHNVLVERLAWANGPVEQADIERSIHSELVIIDAAERRHAAACHRAKDADRACARVLRSLAEDALDDPRGYTWLVNAGKVSSPVTTVGGFLPGKFKLIGVAGALAGTASEISLLVFYDEGSWKDIGVNLAVSGMKVAGGALIAGSAAGARVLLKGGERVFTKTANPAVGERIGTGARKTLDDWTDGWRKKLGLKVPVRDVVPPRQIPVSDSWAKQARFKARTLADQKFVDGWKLATVNGRQAQTMFVAGITLKQGPGVVNTVVGAKASQDARANAEGVPPRAVAGLP